MPKNTKPKNLLSLLNPKSVAIIGASENPTKLGHIVTKNIIESDFKGAVYPINLKSENILGLKVYKSIKDLENAPDLAIISLPVDLVMSSLDEIVGKGCKNVVIFSAGFKEIGPEGAELEKRLIDFANKNSINILGPNCLGFANTVTPINATFGKVGTNTGPLRFLSQSGAVASAIFDWADSLNLGFSEFITLGNKSVLNENDILSHWDENHIENFAPIGMYLESISDGEEFMRLARKLSKSHPIYALKPGKSNAAKKAMQSHTGSIAGEDFVLDQALKQSGVIRCHDLQDMFDLCMGFSWTIPPSGPNVAVISNAGGPAVISTDLITEHGLNLAELSEHTNQVLKEHLPRAASILNPVDVLGDALADRYEVALSAVLKEKSVHSVLVILTPQIMTQIEQTAEVISELSVAYNKPVVCAFVGGSQVATGIKILNKHQVPAYQFPERAIKVLASMWQWVEWKENNSSKVTSDVQPLTTRQQDLLENILSTPLKEKRNVLNVLESNKVLELAHIEVPYTEEVYSFDDAVKFATTKLFPVVLKVSAADFLHKKDGGGVAVNINSISKIKTEYEKMLTVASGRSIVVQKQVPSGTEVIVGIKRDSVFGYVLMFGSGGTFAELVLDRNLLILPAKTSDIAALVENSKIYKILKGYRGSKELAIDKLVGLIEKLVNYVLSTETLSLEQGVLVEGDEKDSGVFSEIEINPVIVGENDVWAVDGKVLL